MINLLPYVKKREFRAARANVLILKYIFITLAALVVLIFMLIYTFIVLQDGRADAQAQIQDSTAELAELNSVNNRADEFRKNLQTTKQILDSETRYSVIIQRLTNTLPSGTTIDGLSVNEQSLGQTMNLEVKARDRNLTDTVFNAFSGNPTYYSDVTLSSITTGGEGEYPVSLSISFTLNPAIAEETPSEIQN